VEGRFPEYRVNKVIEARTNERHYQASAIINFETISRPSRYQDSVGKSVGGE